MTSRGRWYQVSWKGNKERSGGLATNIGIHFFDMLIWLFGGVSHCEVDLRDEWRTGGRLELKNADVSWFMSADPADIPPEVKTQGKTTFRSITVDGQEIEFSEGFTNLHIRSYEEILAGRGFGMEDARPSIELAHRVREQELSSSSMSASLKALASDLI
jgi:UDP-N-acetyl-2-amino-2-deoxyglucuronate dehydrogenase